MFKDLKNLLVNETKEDTSSKKVIKTTRKTETKHSGTFDEFKNVVSASDPYEKKSENNAKKTTRKTEKVKAAAEKEPKKSSKKIVKAEWEIPSFML